MLGVTFSDEAGANKLDKITTYTNYFGLNCLFLVICVTV